MFDRDNEGPRRLKSRRLSDIKPSKTPKKPDAAQLRALYSEDDSTLPPPEVDTDGEYLPLPEGDEGEISQRRGRSRTWRKGYGGRRGADGNDAAVDGDAVDNDAVDPEKTVDATFEAALRILSYGANTRHRLSEKLSRRGFPEGAIAAACDRLEINGILSDKREIGGAVMSLAGRYGPRRIPLELRRLGFDEELIASVDYDELEIDFVACCRRLLGGRERDERSYAALLRRGYTDRQIRAAFEDEDD